MSQKHLSDPAGSTILNSISYYPVYLDVAELRACAEIDTKSESEGTPPLMDECNKLEEDPGQPRGIYDAEELLEIAIRHDCSEFQTLVLLMKNAFEGHCFLAFGITSKTLIDEGMLRIDHAHDCHLELGLHFTGHCEEYADGLHQIWQQMHGFSPEPGSICFDSLLLFILSTRLYKLPVSSLGSFDINKLRNLSEKKKRFYRNCFEISTVIHRAMAEYSVTDHINKLYEERFRDSLVRLFSRENLLMQLKTKLLYASDPLIRTAEELEKRYFSYLIEKEILKDSGKIQVPHASWDDESDAGEHGSSLKGVIKQLFRAISKNCKEAFTAMAEADLPFDATRFFLESNAVYNLTPVDFTDRLIQYHRLIDLFIQVYNIRKIHQLPAIYLDYPAVEPDELWGNLNEECVRKVQQSVAEKISLQKEFNHTSFKSKHIADNELAEIHEAYLKRQIDFLDQRIAEIHADINTIIVEKSSGSLVH
ncbi:MAG: hypothetical protein D4R67_11530 [Bacteroidetes bacterium]|nr:MAG: hypothetical protein D4R67_11530 [Bacteroidota bacterium]